jgi:hypothetical protein
MGQKVPIERPRVRTTDDKEVRLGSYEMFHRGEPLTETVWEKERRRQTLIGSIGALNLLSTTDTLPTSQRSVRNFANFSLAWAASPWRCACWYAFVSSK